MLAMMAGTGGCTTGLQRWMDQGFKVGPEYVRPWAPVAAEWIETDPLVAPQDMTLAWWLLFDDPMFQDLIEEASRQNLQLKQAGSRILESRARLAIARGSLFPQRQEAFGNFAHTQLSQTTAKSVKAAYFDDWNTGFNASWELDFWGRFRRDIEASQAAVGATVEDCHQTLVMLQAEVASTYIQVRLFQERIELAKRNAQLQRQTLALAELRFKGGKTTRLDVTQAQMNLAATQASVPDLEASLREAQNALCVLLGTPPRDLQPELGSAPIPESPPTVAIGLQAQLLARRPDVRRAERLVAQQSARIGIAESDLHPRIAVTGMLGYESRNLSDLWFQSQSFMGTIGPGFRWNILNYGRIINGVGAEHARFQQLVLSYQDTVLRANEEAENAVNRFLREHERVAFLEQGVAAAQDSVDLARGQYQNGSVDFLRLVDSERALVRFQDELAASRGQIALKLVAIYKALGGGWQVPPAHVGILETPPSALPESGVESDAQLVP